MDDARLRPPNSHSASTVRDEELWSIRTITARTGLSRSTIYDYVKRGLFPLQRQLGPRRVAWLASEVRAWIESRPTQTGK